MIEDKGARVFLDFGMQMGKVDEFEQFHLHQQIFEQQVELQELEEQEAIEQAEIQAELEAMEQEELENQTPDEIDCDELDNLPPEEPEEDCCPHCPRPY